MLFGYARVSSKEQLQNYSIGNQVDNLIQAGVKPENIFSEQASSMTFNRPQLNLLLQKVREGDVIYVEKLDRFGRSFEGGMSLILDLSKKGVSVIDLRFRELENNKFILPLVYTLILTIAEEEYKTRKQRQLAGIAKAKLEGKYKGRPPKITARTINLIKKRIFEENCQKKATALSLGISRSHLYNILKKIKKENDG